MKSIGMISKLEAIFDMSGVNQGSRKKVASYTHLKKSGIMPVSAVVVDRGDMSLIRFLLSL